MKTRKKILLIMSVSLLVIMSCKRTHLQPQVINITYYKLMVNNPDDPITIITLLNSYPMGKLTVNDAPSVSLYVCKKNNSRDSMFVFDTNQPTTKTFFDDSYKGQGFIINRINIKNIKAKSVVINVPKGFKIPRYAEYIFGRIDQTSD